MPARISPRAVHSMLTVLAWSALPLWALTVAGVFIFSDDKDMIAAAAAAIVSTLWALIRHAAGNVEQRAKRVDARQAALIGCIANMTGRQTGPFPAAAEGPSGLRRVS